jgi:hypothetical protein
MRWAARDSFRTQIAVIALASLSMAAVAVILVCDVLRSTEQTLVREAQQQCVSAARELTRQFQERAVLLSSQDDLLRPTIPLPFEAEDLSLKGLSTAVLRSYEGVAGGFFLAPLERVAGYVDPSATSATASPGADAARLLACGSSRPPIATWNGASRTAFRKDLYYRLNVVALQVPPLREHPEDLPELVNHLLGKLARQLRLHSAGMTPEAETALRERDWPGRPGNVRELEHTLERALVLSRGAPICPEHLTPYSRPAAADPLEEVALKEGMHGLVVWSGGSSSGHSKKPAETAPVPPRY